MSYNQTALGSVAQRRMPESAHRFSGESGASAAKDYTMKSNELKEVPFGPLFEIAHENKHWLNNPLLPPCITLRHFSKKREANNLASWSPLP